MPGTPLWLGSDPPTAANPYYASFRGWFNDLRLFNRELSSAEVEGLVRGNTPSLALDFEAMRLAEGMTLTDSSDMGRRAVLHTADTCRQGGGRSGGQPGAGAGRP